MVLCFKAFCFASVYGFSCFLKLFFTCLRKLQIQNGQGAEVDDDDDSDEEMEDVRLFLCL